MRRQSDVYLANDAAREKIAVIVDARGVEVPRRPGSTSYRLEGHRVHWELGPRRFDDKDALERALADIARDPPRRSVLPGVAETPLVTIEPKRGATYGDVAEVVDVALAAGLERITFAQ